MKRRCNFLIRNTLNIVLRIHIISELHTNYDTQNMLTLMLHTKGRLFVLFFAYSGSCMRPAAKKHWTREDAAFGYHWTRDGALHAHHKVHSKVQKHVHALKRRYTLCQDDTWPPLPRERDRNPLPFRVPLVLSMFFFDLSTSCIRL